MGLHEEVGVGADPSLSDSTLLEQVGAGSAHAYAALWERHRGPALAFASSFRNIAPAEDLVAEAYTRILAAVRHGKGTTGAFRAYLIATIRNVAISWGRSGRREQAVEDLGPSWLHMRARRPMWLDRVAWREISSRWGRALSFVN